MSDKVTLDLEDLKAVLDIIACSMDFGSGFLDTDEVTVLRRVAHATGMDPEKVTPPNHPHNFLEGEPGGIHCKKAGCYLERDHSRHTTPADL